VEVQHRGTQTRLRFLHSSPVLLVAFAFAVMGDPVSSVAYAIEAALRALHGDLGLLLVTMGLVLGIIVLVSLNYHQLYARFPEGGGDAAAIGKAFGEGWAFLPLGSLIVDYALTITISVAAGASAIIAYLPALASFRILLALGLLAIVAGGTWFGHGGRMAFALMTIAFAAVALIVVVKGIADPVAHGSGHLSASEHHHAGPFSVLLAFPVAMALATGVEAPSSAIAQLGQLDNAGRLRFGRTTLWLMLAIVITLTLGLSGLAVSLRIGLPSANSTLVSQVARAAVGHGAIFAAFQVTTAVLLLAAASSSFQAGPGLLKALSRAGGGVGVLPDWLGRTNRHHTPYWGVATFLLISAALVTAAGAREQRLVLFYAVAVFVAFLCGLLAMAKFFLMERRRLRLTISLLGAIAVTATLGVDLARGDPIVSVISALTISGVLYRLWVKAGRPNGLAEAEMLGEPMRDSTHDEQVPEAPPSTATS
jgi:Amino acid permease